MAMAPVLTALAVRPKMNIGLLVSGLGHLFLLLWMFAAGFFTKIEKTPELQVTQVTILSTQEFDALNAGQPELPSTNTPDMARPAAELTPALPSAPKAEPTPVLKSEPSPTPTLELAPKLMPSPKAPEQPLLSEAPEQTKPQDAPRVAPVAALPPPVNAAIAQDTALAVIKSPDPAPVPEVMVDRQSMAPEAATTQIITEATQTQNIPTLAPQTSARPKTRPTVAPKPEVPPETITDLVAEALAEAFAEPIPLEPEAAPSRPAVGSLTTFEMDSLRLSVQSCWNVGSLSTDALNVVVTIGLSIQKNGMPDAASIRIVAFENGSEVVARQAFEAGRRAIIRCGAKGFKLPKEKYDQWKDVEMVFNPKEMRMK